MELFKDYTFLITRMFDARVASFVKNILKGGGRDVPFRYYSYRVEFQARGLYRIICITISTFASVRPSAIIVVILSCLTSNPAVVPQNVTNKRWYVLRVKNVHFWSPLHPLGP